MGFNGRIKMRRADFRDDLLQNFSDGLGRRSANPPPRRSLAKSRTLSISCDIRAMLLCINPEISNVSSSDVTFVIIRAPAAIAASGLRKS
jgi:hypothetical protein